MTEQSRGFIERNAGKILIAAIILPFPFRALDLWMIALPMDVVLVALVIIGYVQRWRLRKRQGTDLSKSENEGDKI